MRTGVVVATLITLLVSPPAAHAQRAVQVAPDGEDLMVNKPLNGQQWSIVVHFDAQTVIGNVFNLNGSDPQFVHCDIVEPPITSPSDFTTIDTVVLDCRGATGCGAFPCSPAQWTELGQVSVIAAFFVPPVTLHCNEVGPPLCAGVCDVVPGAQCVPLGTGCSCVVPLPTASPSPPPTPTATPQPQATCCVHCGDMLPCGNTCIPFSFICRDPPGCACF
jgi:hypothetical protein